MFSHANWSSLGGSCVNGSVNATAVDASGNLYIGGSFTIAGNVIATNAAKWHGRNWAPRLPGRYNLVCCCEKFGATASRGKRKRSEGLFFFVVYHTDSRAIAGFTSEAIQVLSGVGLLILTFVLIAHVWRQNAPFQKMMLFQRAAKLFRIVSSFRKAF
jgi:hypothetical protein